MTSTATKISLPRSEITFSFFFDFFYSAVFTQNGIVAQYNLHVFALIRGQLSIPKINFIQSSFVVVQTMGKFLRLQRKKVMYRKRRARVCVQESG